MPDERKDRLKSYSLLSLTWPIFLENLFGMLLGIVDTMMLSGYSDTAVTAVGLANQVLTIAGMFFGFLTVGTAVVLNQSLGAGRPQDVERISALSLTLNVILGLLISMTLLLFPGVFLNVFKLSGGIMEQGKVFLSIVGSSMLMVAINMTLGTMLRCRGIVKEMMLVSLASNVINIIGVYIVLKHPFGMPVLGVGGVAASTWVSRLFALLVLLILCSRSLPHRVRLLPLKSFRKEDIRLLFKLGLPSAGEPISYNLSQGVITYFISVLGVAALTTKIYTQNITSFVFVFSMSIGTATQIIVGHLIGSNHKEDAYRSGLRSLKTGLLVTTAVSILLYFISSPLLGLFTSDAGIISLGRELFLLSILLEPARACNMVLISSLNAAGDVRFPVLIGIISMWGISVPMAFLFGVVLHFGLAGIWLAFAIDEWIRALMMFYRWRKQAWKRLVIVSQEQLNM
ncbi:MATE family efflux transporter [Paenibacillus agri]|nr:MATE family efflux transporter [Paenibacillus agri]